jgi:hypothetical protein
VYRVLMGKPEGKRPLGRPRRRRERNTRILTDLRGIRWVDVDWIHLAQDRDHWRDIVNMVSNICAP